MGKHLDYKTLRTDIDTHIHPNATGVKDGLLSKEDKLKLDTVEERANHYVHPSRHKAVEVEEDATHRFVTDVEKQKWNNLNASQISANGGTNVQSEIDSLKSSVSNGKNVIATAITDKGVQASGNDSFNTLATKIGNIETGVDLPMLEPRWTIGIGVITGTCETLNNSFTKFRVNGGGWQTSNVFPNLQPKQSYTFEGMYLKGKVASLVCTTPKANQPKPTAPVVVNKTDSTITVRVEEGCKIKYNNNLYTSPYTFTNLQIDTIYSFFSVREGTNTLNENISEVANIRTSNERLLLNNDGTGILNDISKWKKTRNEGKYSLKVENNNLVLTSGSETYSTSLRVISVDKVIPTGFSKVKFDLNFEIQGTPNNFLDYISVFCGGEFKILKVNTSGSYEFDIKNSTENYELEFLLSASNNNKTIVRISNIALVK